MKKNKLFSPLRMFGIFLLLFLLYNIYDVLILSSGCAEKLGNNYYYLNKYQTQDIGCPDGAIIYKSDNSCVYSNILIEKQVIDVDYNDNYIIAKRQIIDDSLFSILILDYSEFKPEIGYYIILKNKDSVCGSYSKKEYLQKRKELGVPDNLKLK